MQQNRHIDEALRQVPFFAQLSQDELAELSARLVARRFSPGQIIFHYGDPGGLLYIIQKGKIKITTATPEGQEALLAILGKDDFFGEFALLDEAPRSASAEAIEPTETLTLHREDFMRFLRNNPDFALHVLRTLTQRVRNLNSQISDIFFLDLPARLARVLLNLAEQHGIQTAEGIRIDLSLTQTDLAEMTGATRVSINKALGRFRREKWISVKGRRFTILDQEAMQYLIQISGGTV
ncbi:MAG: Crp/Fnr family transcriptional regulator [Chloroflexi bacterium]|nr:Crp/Fnr family transcriptional regulator [Chloroflexota bacterium]MBK6712397.1 Crp/Fnr family transcriptional regulator [Chloroflexota bacterium]MBK7179018.1 Crp/Fnr family transcriptional regulator [Chloroflexota bacterium]MBK7916944.1 Crp/Fnr family transcriptional regulator [Chloroflexota bacterium]MBK8933650.1 Crp/Fnr family transcriptional regulator [Chloroflexota bacterium]